MYSLLTYHLRSHARLNFVSSISDQWMVMCAVDGRSVAKQCDNNNLSMYKISALIAESVFVQCFFHHEITELARCAQRRIQCFRWRSALIAIASSFQLSSSDIEYWQRWIRIIPADFVHRRLRHNPIAVSGHRTISRPAKTKRIHRLPWKGFLSTK